MRSPGAGALIRAAVSPRSAGACCALKPAGVSPIARTADARNLMTFFNLQLPPELSTQPHDGTASPSIIAPDPGRLAVTLELWSGCFSQFLLNPSNLSCSIWMDH